MLFAQDRDVLKDGGKEAIGAVMLARRNRLRASDDLLPAHNPGLHTGPAKVDPDSELRGHETSVFPTLRFAIIRKPSSVRFG